MRLLEFLQPIISSPRHSSYHMVKIPMWVLESDRTTYDRFTAKRLTESFMLQEGALDRYKTMINVFAQIDQMGEKIGMKTDYYTKALEELEWAMQVLRREDRIIWYMRLVKANLITKVAHTPVNKVPENQVLIDFIIKEQDKAMGKLQKVYGGSADAELNRFYHGSRTLREQFIHFMSLGLPGINNVQWNNQTQSQLFDAFSTIENEWMETRDSIINHEEQKNADEITKIIEFDDGSAWFNLNRAGCSMEANAMGHCGNGGDSQNGSETVLSYRVPVDEHGRTRDPKKTPGTYWKPRLTFILHEHGILGEMKGRANSKPKEELHPVILRLLMNDIIQGIAGGGYKPENNFSLDDLGEENKKKVLQRKPQLGTLLEQYEIVGKITDHIVNRLAAEFDAYDIEYTNIDNEYIHVERFDSFANFLDTYKNNLTTAKAVSDQLSDAGERWEFDSSYYYGDTEDKENLLDDVRKKDPGWFAQLQEYIRETYGEELEDEDNDYDIDHTGDIVRLLIEEGDEIYDQLGWAISDGHRRGAEDDMYETFEKWIKNDDFFDRSGLQLVPDNPTVYRDDTGWTMVMPTLSFIKGLHAGYYEMDSFAYNSWPDVVGNGFSDIEEPRYGWSGYNEEATIEYVIEQIKIPEIDHIEVPDAGNVTKKQFESFQKDLKGNLLTSTTVRDMADKYKTVVNNVGITNGVITANVWTWVNEPEFQDNPDKAKKAFAGTIKDMAVIATEHQVPLVIRKMHQELITDEVYDIGYKKQKNGYLRFDPPITETIKIRGRDTGSESGLDGFLSDLNNITTPHPFDHRSVLYGAVSMDVSKFGDDIHLGDITTYAEQKQGHATKALQMLKTLADKHHVTIQGTAKAYSKNPAHIQDTKRLLQWYQKNGFEVLGGYPEDGYEIQYIGRGR